MDFNEILYHKKLQYKNTARWFEWITNRINSNKNFLCAVVGSTGSGKSYAALAAAEILDKNFNINHVTFSLPEFLELINSNLPSGSVIIFDEAGLAMARRDYFSKDNKDVIKLLQLFRHKNYIVFFTVPDIGFIDKNAVKLLHAIWEMKKVTPSLNRSTVKAKYVYVNPVEDKNYSGRYLIYRNKIDNAIRKIQYIYFKKPSVKLNRQYEAKKEEYAKNFYLSLYSKYNTEEAQREKIKIKWSAQEELVRNKLEEDPEIGIQEIAKYLGVQKNTAAKWRKQVLYKLKLEEIEKAKG